MNFITTISLSILCSFLPAVAYESMHEKTPVGKIIIFDLPNRTALEATSQSGYFYSDNGLFRKLFKYISANDVSMTTPVEAEINPGKMRFFIGQKDLGKKLISNKSVKVLKVPKQKVVSIGIRGSYTKETFFKNKKALEIWLSKNKNFTQSGEAYGVYWNGPFVPGFFKRSEIHIPIKSNPKKIKQ